MIARKIMLLGDIGVGKSSIAKRLVFGRFDFDYKPTIGVDIYRYDVPADVGVNPMSFIVWDTDGNFGQAIFRHVYIKEAAAAFIVGDVTRSGTLDSMIRLADGFNDALPGRYCTFIVNKTDLLNPGETAQLPPAFIERHMPVVTTSAKTGAHIQDAFIDAARAIQRRDS